MDLATLRRQFASSRFLTFDEINGLTRIHVATPQATATVFLQGAHLTAWQPAGQHPVIYLSHRSDLAPGKPLRGGIPIVFPWFATDKKPDRIDGHPGPPHGFARIQDWTLASATHTGEDVILTFTLGPTAISRSMGFDSFDLTLTFTIGHTLTLALTVHNAGDQPLVFEEAFHTYFHVTDIHEVTVDGLEPTPYIDKTDNFTLKPAANAPIHPTQATDRVYNNTAATCTIHDGVHDRLIIIRKQNSNTTIVWNPWKELPDLGPWEWHEYIAVETANADPNNITLAPGAHHTMAANYSIQKA